MPFTPAQLPEASNTAIEPINNIVPMDIDVEDQSPRPWQLHKSSFGWPWRLKLGIENDGSSAERYWQLLKVESWKTRLSDKEAAMEACSAIMVVEVRIAHVSLQFFMAFVSGVNLVFQLHNLEQALLTPEKLLAPFPGEGKTVSLQF